MSITVHITDNTPEFKAAFERGIKAGLEAVGGQAERNVKLLTPVDTGRLRNSITHETRSSSVAVGSNVDYAPYVELGHRQEPGRYVPAIGARLVASYVSPKPYLRPGIENHMAEYGELLERYVVLNLP